MAIDKCDALAVAAMAALHQDDPEDALVRCDRLVRLATKCESVMYTARGHVWRGTAHMLLNETTDADRLVRSGIGLLWENGCRFDWCESIEALACLAARCGDAQESARLLGACVRIRKEMQSPRSLTYTGWLDEAKTTAITSLGAAEYGRAVAAGAALSDEELMAYVERTRGTRGRPAIGWQSLTPTELQVAELVREGLTNRQIAERLLMGAETVKTHVSHIFSKLDIAKRSQLAAIASEHTNKDGNTRP
jgi:DNA-binding CsgD family transcriptional regulator